MKTGNLVKAFWIICVVLIQTGSAQWKPVNGPSKNVLFLSANGETILAQTDSSFYFSTDNGWSWTQANSNMADTLVSFLPADTTNFLLGDTYYQIPPLPPNLNVETAKIELSSLLALVTSLSIEYPQTYLDSIYIVLDTGTTAMGLSEIASQLALYAAGIDTADVLSQIQMAKAEISTNGGEDWISIQEVLSSISVRAIQNTDDFVFVGTNRGVFRATINETGFTQVNGNIGDTNVFALASIGPNLFAGTHKGIYLTTDYGTTWKSVDNGLTNTIITSLMPYNNSLFAGTFGGGVFGSANYGSSWKGVNQGLNSKFINALAISDSTLFAGTQGGGLWRRYLSEINSVRQPQDGTPGRFSLMQNYPNPFNPSTVITYQIPSVGKVTLKIYDVLGREVATLVNGVKNPGSYEVKFDAGNLPSGAYFYTLRSGNYVQTSKLLLLK